MSCVTRGTVQFRWTMRYAQLAPQNSQAGSRLVRSPGLVTQSVTHGSSRRAARSGGTGRMCESGGIGRRTRLRIWRGNPWGFESPLSHQLIHSRTSPDSAVVRCGQSGSPSGGHGRPDAGVIERRCCALVRTGDAGTSFRKFHRGPLLSAWRPSFPARVQLP